MNASYKDITERLGLPLWYDALGYPRYCEFSPKQTSNIYSNLVFLTEIACQECGKRFDVASSFDVWDVRSSLLQGKFDEIFKQLEPKEQIYNNYWVKVLEGLSKDEFIALLHYGDPPRHDDEGMCTAGDTMNCVDVKVKECWIRESCDFIRHPEFETLLEI